jgi:hypothetical protein
MQSFGSYKRLVCIESPSKPIQRHSVEAAGLQCQPTHASIAACFDRVLINVLADVSHFSKVGQRFIELADRTLDRRSIRLGPCSQKGCQAKPTQADNEELKISPPTKDEGLVLWLVGLKSSALEGDHMYGLIRETARPLDCCCIRRLVHALSVWQR